MRPVPVLWRVDPLTIGLVMSLSLVMRLRVVSLLLVLLGRVHTAVSLRVLLTCHVVRVRRPSLQVVGGLGGRIVEGIDSLAVIRVVSRWVNRSAHVCLVVVWMWRVSHSMRAHSSIDVALGMRRHGWILTMWQSSLRLHTQATAHLLVLMMIGTKRLMFISIAWWPRCHHRLLWRNGRSLCVCPTWGLTW